MMNRQRIPTLDIFIEVYKAFPANFYDREEIEESNNVILPPTALQKLTSMRTSFSKESPVLFRILNIELNMYTHCGVSDFTADDDTCILPTNMFNRLCLEPGQMVNLRNIPLDRGTLIKIQPHKTEFIDLPNPKTILENSLRNYFCLTEGDTINVKFNHKFYLIDIVECKPKKAIKTVNSDIKVDFLPPKDYKETPVKKENKKDSSNNNNDQFRQSASGNINFNSSEKPNKKMTDEELQKIIEDKKFNGHHFRMDGKQISATMAKKIESKRKKEEEEVNYDPRKNRIISVPRPKFHYVGSLGDNIY